jgi:hypothetical protein
MSARNKTGDAKTLGVTKIGDEDWPPRICRLTSLTETMQYVLRTGTQKSGVRTLPYV